MSAENAAFHHVLDFRWRQGDPNLTETEARLHDLRALQSALAEIVEIAVADARAEDLTWAQIGGALGISPQATVRRYGQRGVHR